MVITCIGAIRIFFRRNFKAKLSLFYIIYIIENTKKDFSVDVITLFIY